MPNVEKSHEVTHNCCDKKLAKYGGLAKCCECEGCEFCEDRNVYRLISHLVNEEDKETMLKRLAMGLGGDNL